MPEYTERERERERNNKYNVDYELGPHIKINEKRCDGNDSE